MSALEAREAMYWHDMDVIKRKERIDEEVLYQRRKLEMVERRPAPLNLTDTERMDWFGEHCDSYKYFEPTKTTIGHHEIICNGERTTAASFRDAVDLAAAKHKEANS